MIVKDRYILRTGNKIPDNYNYPARLEKMGVIKISPLSSSQREMWLIEQMQPGNYAYNLSIAFFLKGELNFQLLENSFNKIIHRHEILRTSFGLINSELRQLIHNDLALKINKIYADGKTEPNSYLRDLVAKPFDLSKLPLIRVNLIEFSKTENMLLICIHHIISDGLSLTILLDELSRIYNSLLEESDYDLPELKYQYADYIKMQSEKEWSPSFREQQDYWQNQLKDELSNLDLPFDKKRNLVQSPAGSNEFFLLPKDLADMLQSIGGKRGCTFYMTFLAVFQIFLSKYSGNEDIIVGSPVSNRPEIAENLIGNFLNVIVLRNNTSQFEDFLSYLKRTRQSVIEALKNLDLPFEKLVTLLKIKRDLSRNPLFQVMLQILPKMPFHLTKLEVTQINFDAGYSQLDLSLHLYQTDNGYNCRLEYDTDLFEKDTIQRMINNFRYFLLELVKNPGQKLSEISVTSPEEKDIVSEWNKTQIDFPNELTLTRLIEQQVAMTPRKIAVIFGSSRITYDELNRKANQLAKYLQSLGAGPETIIGICMDRSIEMIIGMLGILKAGGAYLPIDPGQPSERIQYIAEDAGLRLILTLKKNTQVFNNTKYLVYLDSEWDKIKKYDSENPVGSITSQNAAYVIYTSGSTGNPKGVIIEHNSLVNFLLSMKQKPGISAEDVLLAVTTISFDIAGLEIFLPLISGARVILAGKTEAGDGKLLNHLILKNKVSILQATPSTWKLMIDAGWNKTPRLKMLCGGEAFSKAFAESLLERGKELWNMYGPTETTIWSSVNKIEPHDEDVYIGKPIANSEFYVVDKDLNPVPIGVAGELLIGGAGLARGYLNNEKLTSDKFIPDPFKGGSGKLYRTGDQVKCHISGRILFLGRLDYQVKIRGFRIELGEVENVINRNNGVRQSIVQAVKISSSDKRLSAYVIPESFDNFSIEDLKSRLKQFLPDYMIPSYFIKMKQFPLTQNGKIDRKKLPPPDKKDTVSACKYVSPRDDLDLQLIHIWEHAFGIKNIGINDDFFELGGHSLLAAHIFAEINKYLGKNLPLAALFHTATISGIADMIRGKLWKPLWSSIVPLKVTGNKTPVFLIHGAEGNILLYKNLIKYLEVDRPVYGLQSQGLDGKSPLLNDVKEMAQKYIMEIKGIQPDGPYLLGGYCLGGVIAYEIAQQLTGSGDVVDMVAMIETYNIKNTPPSFVLRTFHRIQNLFFQLMNLRLSLKDSRLQYFNEKFNVELNRIRVKLKILNSRLSSIFSQKHSKDYQHLLINEINDRAQNSYTPKAYTGKVILFKPIRYFTCYNDYCYGWENLIEDMNIIEMPCYPRGSLNKPFVKYLAEKFNEALDSNYNNKNADFSKITMPVSDNLY